MYSESTQDNAQKYFQTFSTVGYK